MSPVSKSGTAMRLAAAWLCALVAACAVPPPAGEGAGRDLPTESDQTAADRRARVRLALAAEHFAAGRLSTALDEVKLALAARPDMPEALNLRGLVYAGMGEPRLAEESYRRALQSNPRDADTMHNLGWLLCQNKRLDEADALFRQALAQPQYRAVQRTLLAQGVCLANAARWEDAERTLARAYELDPTSPVVAYNLSDVLYRRGEFERARFYIRRVNAVPDAVNAQSLWLAARVEHRLGNLAGAQVLGRQLRDRFPQSPEALLYERGRFND